MKRLFHNARFPLALLGAAGLAACVVSVDFSMNKDLVVDTAGGVTSVAQVVPVDLTSYKEIQDHKGNVDHLNFNSADLTITEVRAGNRSTKVSGKVALRASGAAADGSQDVQVTQLTNFVIAQGSKLHVQGNSTLDKFLMDTLKGDGKFSVVVSGTTDGEAHFTLNAKVNASLGYGVF
jgi:hypothetical protein